MSNVFEEIPNTDDFWVEIEGGAGIESHFDVSAYLNARDEWVKKASEHHNIYVGAYRNMTEHAIEQENKLDAIKKCLESIPESFIIQAYTVLNRGTPDHHLWNFEIWYTDVKKILESSEFTTKDEEQ